MPFDDVGEQPVWRLTRPRDLVWRDWGESGVVYDAGSGSTHLLNALGIELLSLLMVAPRSEKNLLAELIADMPEGLEAEEFTFQIVSQLRQLQDLGVAEPDTIAA